MKKLKNRIAAITISIFFILSMTASITLIPSASSHTPPWSIPEYAYISAFPNPIGVGQTIVVYMWLDSVYGAAGGATAAVGTNGYTASSALLSNNYRFLNYELFITPPSGTTTEVTFPIVSDPTSSQLYQFTPTAVGTYTFNFTYPGQVYGANGNGYSGSILMDDNYLPASASTTLTVQQTPIPGAITGEPLPTNYWTEPIYGENSNWYAISSNWLGSSAPVPAGYTSTTVYHGDAVGPITSHIMWTKPIMTGGVVGGNLFPDSPGLGYFEGSAYQPRYQNPIIMDGYLYYTESVSFTGIVSGPTVCVDLRTGQQLWSNPNIPAISFGYIYNVENPDQHGVFPPILFTAGFARAFDAFTGLPMFNVTGVPSGTTVAGPNGEQLKYVFANAGTTANPQWYLSEWNSSKLWQYDTNPYTGGGSLSPSIVNASNGLLISPIPVPLSGATGTLPPGAPAGTSNAVPYGSSLTVNANIPLNSGALAPGSTTTAISAINQGSLTTYDWNVSVPWRNTITSTVTVVAANTGDVMLCYNGSLPGGFAAAGSGANQFPYTMFAVNLNASVGTIGSILWMKTYNPPTGNVTLQMGAADWQTRVWVMYYEETMQWVGYSLANGNLLWGPTTSETAFDYYEPPTPASNLAYGKLYSMAFGGVLYCRDDSTGTLLWTYGNGGGDNSTYAGFNTAYGVYPTFVQSIANGVVYIANIEHTIPDPIYKGETSFAINATTGQLIWQLSDYASEWSTPGVSWVVADGFATFMNGYDQQMYCVGRGPSATTVTAPNIGVTTATPVTITGAVMDITAGTMQKEQAADFPHGVPCASDASMSAWMSYVYQQQAEPTNFTGVPVQLSVLDSNGNQYSIGTATTNEYGTYALTWTPQITGNYTIYATFAGTNGYWPSSADTYIYATSPPATPAPTATPLNGLATQNAVMYIGIAIIIVIIVGIVALAMIMLRKRP